MKPLGSVLAALALGLAGCGAAEERSLDAAQAPERGVSGYGLALRLPRGWVGRVYRLSPEYAITLEAATAPLPPEGDELTIDGLKPGDAYVRLDDIGPPPAFIGRDEDWRVDPALPLAIARSELRGPYTGGFPSGASMSVVLAGRALMIRVRFGSDPTDERVRDVNEVLASLSVRPVGTG